MAIVVSQRRSFRLRFVVAKRPPQVGSAQAHYAIEMLGAPSCRQHYSYDMRAAPLREARTTAYSRRGWLWMPYRLRGARRACEPALYRVSLQAIARIVGYPDGFFFVTVGDDRQHRPEDFLAGDPHVVAHAEEYGRPHEPAGIHAVRQPLAAGDQPRLPRCRPGCNSARVRCFTLTTEPTVLSELLQYRKNSKAPCTLLF